MVFTVREMRWLALLAITVAIGQSRITGHALELRLGGSSLVPVPSAFEMWEAILLVFAGCLVYELFRNRHGVAASDRVSPLVAASGVLASLLLVWNLWMTMAVSVALAIVATIAYVQVHRDIEAGRSPRWLGVPFALLLGFAIIIAISAIDAAVARDSLAVCLVATASMGTIWLAVNTRDAVLPGLVGWLMTQVSAYDHSVLAGALIGGGACAGVALFLVFSSHPPGSPPPRAALR